MTPVSQATILAASYWRDWYRHAAAHHPAAVRSLHVRADAQATFRCCWWRCVVFSMACSQHDRGGDGAHTRADHSVGLSAVFILAAPAAAGGRFRAAGVDAGRCPGVMTTWSMFAIHDVCYATRLCWTSRQLLFLIAYGGVSFLIGLHVSVYGELMGDGFTTKPTAASPARFSARRGSGRHMR